jgi:hypothetical protein
MKQEQGEKMGTIKGTISVEKNEEKKGKKNELDF